MVVCVSVMVLRPFITRPLPYNSVVAAFIGPPVISDDLEWENDYYTPLLLPIHNISIIFFLITLYAMLCYNVFKMSRVASRKVDKVQLQLFLQALVICTSTTTASILYVVVEFVPVPKIVIVLANVIWQLSHGLHGVVYILLNRRIRREVLRLFSLNGRLMNVAPMTTASVLPMESQGSHA